MKIRKATPSDAEALQELYHNHLTQHPPKEPKIIDLWREKISRFEISSMYHLLVGEIDNRIISSVTLVVIENLRSCIQNKYCHKNQHAP